MRYLYFYFHSNTTQNSQLVEAAQMSTSRRLINEMWCTHAVENYSASRRKKVPTPATTWMNPEDMMLGEMASHKKTMTAKTLVPETCLE